MTSRKTNVFTTRRIPGTFRSHRALVYKSRQYRGLRVRKLSMLGMVQKGRRILTRNRRRVWLQKYLAGPKGLARIRVILGGCADSNDSNLEPPTPPFPRC